MLIYSAPTAPTSPEIDVDVAGRRFGFLAVEYRKNRHFACRCVCDRLVHVAAEALADGTVTSCGCQPASPAFRTMMRDLAAQRRREIAFSIGRGR
jgi:hypothetical protein